MAPGGLGVAGRATAMIWLGPACMEKVRLAMSTSTPGAEAPARLEAVLARYRPFGDWQYIDERTWARYQRRLETLAASLPAARPLLAALTGASAESRYHVLGDPVVRSAIDITLAATALGASSPKRDDIEAVFDAAARHLADGRCAPPLNAAARMDIRLGPAPHHAWVWCEERDADAFGSMFLRLVDELLGPGSALRTPDDDARSTLRDATHLLGELLPALARSALDHVHLVAVVDVVDRRHMPFESVSAYSIPGTVLLSAAALDNPWRAAERLLREAMHQKQHDLQHTHSLFSGLGLVDSPPITALWRRSRPHSSNQWSVSRAFGAFHVYVHLALFFTVAERRAAELTRIHGPIHVDPAAAARRALDRAHYLAGEIRRVGWHLLGPAGQRMVDWLFDILTELDPALPPAGTHVHLLLDRYEAEAREVGKLVAPRSARPILLRLIATELAAARWIAAWIGGSSQLPDPSIIEVLHRIPDRELGQAFKSARAIISQFLHGATPDDLALVVDGATGQTLAQVIEALVEESSLDVNSIVKCAAQPTKGQ